MDRITTLRDWESAQRPARATPAETALIAASRHGRRCLLTPLGAPILVSPAGHVLAEDAGVANPAAVWSAARAPGRDRETFNRDAYAADVVIPILDFGQTDAWAPSTARGRWGVTLWWARWVLSFLGWVVTALGAAAVTGLIRRD